MKLFGRRRWCPVVFCVVVLILLVILLVMKMISLSHSIRHRRTGRYRGGWLKCPGCHNPDPLPMSELDSNLLLILVHSSVKRKDRRDAIRSTWLADYHLSAESSPVHYNFVLGGANLSSDMSKQLQDESTRHNDIIIIPSNPDNARELTQRTIESFQMAVEKLKFSYVLKCDDDTYADVPRVASKLQRRRESPLRRETPLYWGELLTWKIHQDGLYGEKLFTVCDRYLPYALGGGYILSRDLVELLVENAPYLHRYVSEDVSVGAWLAPLNFQRLHDTRFNTGANSRGCKDPYLVSHKISPEQMYSYYDVYKKDGRFCSHRNRDKGTAGHIYNWSVLPSWCLNYYNQLP